MITLKLARQLTISPRSALTACSGDQQPRYATIG
jgi:hypothetical protein